MILSDYYAIGYLIIKADKPDWPQLALLPDKLVSLSDCICPHLYIYWGWDKKHQHEAIRFGFTAETYNTFCDWVSEADAHGFEYPGVFKSLSAARSFVHQFLSHAADMMVIGVGLPTLLEEPASKILSEQLLKVFARHEVLEDGGSRLGHELASFDYGAWSHSWLCNYINQDMNELYGIETNSVGLIDAFEDAYKVYEWIAEDDLRGTRAEPEPYLPWLLLSYPLLS